MKFIKNILWISYWYLHWTMLFTEKDVLVLLGTNYQFLVIFLIKIYAIHFAQVSIWIWSWYWSVLKILFHVNMLLQHFDPLLRRQWMLRSHTKPKFQEWLLLTRNTNLLFYYYLDNINFQYTLAVSTYPCFWHYRLPVVLGPQFENHWSRQLSCIIYILNFRIKKNF